MKTKIFLPLAIVFAILFTQCTKEGPAGPQGTAGNNGTNGTNGNANVTGSTTVTTNSASWTAISTWGFSAIINLGAIDQDIVDKGAVMVYEQLGTGWLALPYTYGKVSRSYLFSPGMVKIYIQNTDGSTATNPGAITYRIVVISASNRMAHPNVDYTNYEEVKMVFGLKD